MSNINIYPAFAVPMAEVYLPNAKKLNAALKALILAKESEGTKYKNPNPSLKQQPGVFESDFNFFSWQDSCVRELRDFCWASLGQLVATINGYSAEEMSRIRIYSHTWFHVTRHMGFTINHTHPMASWSGVYCVDPGEQPEDFPESGVLRFHGPASFSNMFLDAGNSNLKRPFHHGSWSVKFQAGQLVFFPSWLAHEVLPFFGKDTRITVAMNCWFGSN